MISEQTLKACAEAIQNEMDERSDPYEPGCPYWGTSEDIARVCITAFMESEEMTRLQAAHGAKVSECAEQFAKISRYRSALEKIAAPHCYGTQDGIDYEGTAREFSIRHSIAVAALQDERG